MNPPSESSTAEGLLLVFMTAPEADAARIARTIVEQRWAACVNVMPGVRSFYRWQGAVQDDREVLLIAKTTTAQLETLRQGVLGLHPYQVPEIVAVPAVAAHAPYMAWVLESIREETT